MGVSSLPPSGAEPDERAVEIAIDDAVRVSGLLRAPPLAKLCFVVAHGAGAGMHHPFMTSLARELATRAIASLRYQFPYMEKHRRRPDPPAVCHATVRAAVSAAHTLLPALPLLAGGKSFGGRMTSQAQASSPLAQIRGLVFLGFPLHPPQEPGTARGEHLLEIQVPMLFIQGARDAYAQPQLLNPLVERLSSRAAVCVLAGADHSFHVPTRGPVTQEKTDEAWLNALATWALRCCESHAE